MVVIAVIALLVAIVLPSLGRAKLMAERTSCSANFRAIGVAAGLYQGDWPGYVPIYYKN